MNEGWSKKAERDTTNKAFQYTTVKKKLPNEMKNKKWHNTEGKIYLKFKHNDNYFFKDVLTVKFVTFWTKKKHILISLTITVYIYSEVKTYSRNIWCFFNSSFVVLSRNRNKSIFSIMFTLV